VLVEAMGHVNFGRNIYGRKGLTKSVQLNGQKLLDWNIYLLPMNPHYIAGLRPGKAAPGRRGVFFKGVFTVKKPHDTYIDMSEYKIGMVWVNGHNLGRHWDIGPQHSLYCPASFLKAGRNEIVVLDLLQVEARPVRGITELK